MKISPSGLSPRPSHPPLYFAYRPDNCLLAIIGCLSAPVKPAVSDRGVANRVGCTCGPQLPAGDSQITSATQPVGRSCGAGERMQARGHADPGSASRKAMTLAEWAASVPDQH